MSARKTYINLQKDDNVLCSQCHKFIPEYLQSSTRIYCSNACSSKASETRKRRRLRNQERVVSAREMFKRELVKLSLGKIK